MKIILFALFIIGLLINLVQGRKCRALAMSGGGSKGAYEAAVIMGLLNNVDNPQENLAWDVVTGVSAGSLNALGMGAFRPDQIEEASAFLYALWDSIPDYNAYGNWPGGIVQGLFFKSSIFTLQPGIEWVTEKWGNHTVNRKVSFATVDSNAAEYEVYEYEPTGTLPSDYIESAFASSSIPVVFPPVKRGDKMLIDGGVIWNLDVPTAIRRCREIVDSDSDIIFDFILCGDHSLAKVADLSKYKTIDHYMRATEIKSFYTGMSDYNSSLNMYPDVTFRYLIAPSENISVGLLPLDFNRAQIDKCYEVGKKDAKNAVKLGPGGYGKILLEYTEKLRNGEKPDLDSMINAQIAKIDSAHLESQ